MRRVAHGLCTLATVAARPCLLFSLGVLERPKGAAEAQKQQWEWDKKEGEGAHLQEALHKLDRILGALGVHHNRFACLAQVCTHHLHSRGWVHGCGLRGALRSVAPTEQLGAGPHWRTAGSGRRQQRAQQQAGLAGRTDRAQQVDSLGDALEELVHARQVRVLVLLQHRHHAAVLHVHQAAHLLANQFRLDHLWAGAKAGGRDSEVAAW